MNKDAWLEKLKPKNLVSLINTANRQKINVMIHRISPEVIRLNNGVIISKATGKSIDDLYFIEPLK